MVTRVSSATIEGGHIERQFAQDIDTTTGLTYGYKGGYLVAGNVVTTIADGTVTLTDASSNYVYISTTGTPAVMVSTTQPSADYVQIALVVTAGGEISSVTDSRTKNQSWQSS